MFFSERVLEARQPGTKHELGFSGIRVNGDTGVIYVGSTDKRVT